MLPAGPEVPLTGGLDFNDRHAIWVRLDTKRSDMAVRQRGAVKARKLDIPVWKFDQGGA